MDEVNGANAHSDADGPKIRTPAYAAFEANTDKLSNLLGFARLGSEHFMDQLKVSVRRDIDLLSAELPEVREQSGGEATKTRESLKTSSTSREHEAAERIKKLRRRT